MKSKLYFLHIHKVGGNSLVKVLRKGYSENESSLSASGVRLSPLPREEIMRYRFFSGHFGTGLYSLLHLCHGSVHQHGPYGTFLSYCCVF